MTIQNHLLKKITEECAEVIKEISKAELFGMEDCEPNQELTNQQKIQDELADLLGAIQLVCEHGILNDREIFNTEKIDAKKIKIKKWMKYSQDKGITDV